MSSLLRSLDLDGPLFDFLALAILGIAIASSVAWLASRLLFRDAATRHLVLFAGLTFCLAFPPALWLSRVSRLTIVELPLFSAMSNSIAEADPASTNGDLSESPRPSRSRDPFAERDVPPPRADRAAASVEPSDLSEAAPASRFANGAPPASARALQTEWTEVFAREPFSFRGMVATGGMIWALGCAAMLVRLALECLRVVRLRRDANISQDEARLRVLGEVSLALGLGRVPTLLESSSAVVPLAAGLGRPAIVLPALLLTEIGDDELRDVLVHEAEHLRRGDHWIVLLQRFAGALYWPIPSVHLLNREMRRSREELCDNAVLERRDPILYGRTLLRVAESSQAFRSLGAAVGMFDRRGELERRISRLIDPRRSRRMTPGRSATWCVTLAFLVAGALFATTRFAVSADPEPATPPTSEASTPATDPAAQAADPNAVVTLHGKVLDPEGHPIAGAKLSLVLDDWTDPVALGRSEVDGSYRFVMPESRLHRSAFGNSKYAECKALIVAVAEGLGVGWEELPSENDSRFGRMKEDYARDVRLSADLPVEGRVVDMQGQPVAGAKVAVEAMHSLTDGRWFKMLPAIASGDPNYMTEEQADVVNWFTPLYPTAWQVIPAATTDAEGRFRIAGIGADRAAVLEVSGPGIRNSEIGVVTREDAEDYARKVRELYPRQSRPHGYFYPPRDDRPDGDQGVQLFGPSPTIEVDPARTIAGTVRLVGTGEPLANVEVMVNDGFAAGSARTDVEGRYRLVRAEDADSIEVAVRPEPEQFVTVVQRIENAKAFGETTLDFELPQGTIVRGRALEAGTNRPLVSGPERGCHSVEPGELQTGNVTYYPLATNKSLIDSPAGVYFHGLTVRTNYSVSTSIEPDGSFSLRVPPGPGVLILQSNPGSSVGDWQWMGSDVKESDGVHLRSPYLLIDGRTKDDGGPPGDDRSLPGFEGPISLDREAHIHAYRVIDPPADAKTLDLDLFAHRGGSRTLNFDDVEGRPSKGAVVQGLVGAGGWFPFRIALDDAEVELVGLTPGEARTVSAMSADGKFAANVVVSTDDPLTKTIRLVPTATVTGRIVDEAGQPLPEVQIYAAANVASSPPQFATDGEGRFRLGPLVADVPYDAVMYRRGDAFNQIDLGKAFEQLVLRPGEVRDLGDVRVKLPAAATE